MALVTKVRAEVNLTLQDKAETGHLSFVIDTPRQLDSLDGVPGAVAEMISKRISLLAKAAPTPVEVAASVVGAAPVAPTEAPPAAEPGESPAPRRRRSQS